MVRAGLVVVLLASALKLFGAPGPVVLGAAGAAVVGAAVTLLVLQSRRPAPALADAAREPVATR